MTTLTATQTMQALTTTFGDDSQLTLTDVALPEPGPTEIRVAVHAAGINPVDWKSRVSGGFDRWTATPILGWDVSGVVDAVGGGVTHLRPGDEVFGMPAFPHQAGAYADFVVGRGREFARKPAELTHVEAAALPLAGLTAWQALHDTAQVGAGDRVLVHAAAGGVGHLAVQIAKALGATVIGTASAAKHDLVRELGADAVVDYRATPFEEAVGTVDVVLDTIGGDYGARSLRVLRDGGRLVTLTGADQAPPAERGIRTGWTLVEPDGAGMAALARLVGEGRLRPVVAGTFPLADAEQAHAAGRTGRTAGKLVLTVR